MKKTLHLASAALLALFLSPAISRPQGVLDPGAYSVARGVDSDVALEPLALPALAVAGAEAPAWRPRLPTFRGTLQFRYVFREEGREGVAQRRSLNTFDVPHAHLFITGEAFPELDYGVSFRLSSNSRDIFQNGYLRWRPNAQFSIIPKGLTLSVGKFDLAIRPARGTSHVWRLVGADSPFLIAPPSLPGAKIVGVRPEMRLFDERLWLRYTLTHSGVAPGQQTNTGNHFRHQIGASYSLFGRFPIFAVTEHDLRRSPFNVNLGYAYVRSMENLCRTVPPAVSCTGGIGAKVSAANYHSVDAVMVWRGLFATYGFTARDQVDTKGGIKLNGKAQGHNIILSYAIPTPWGDLVPFYQFNMQSAEDRRTLRGSGVGLFGGSVLGYPFLDTKVGFPGSRTFEVREHWFGLNLYLAGEALALKTNVRVDTLRDTVGFQFLIQHQWFFNPEGKYR